MITQIVKIGFALFCIGSILVGIMSGGIFGVGVSLAIIGVVAMIGAPMIALTKDLDKEIK